ncbi:MAG: sugar kinase, partial [Pirellulaceae bacterium]|nr:sugar kinase [Pirellulaceae bacterium]
MPLLVVGSVAFDSVETPTDSRENVLGGSATYFSYAASYFTSVRLVGAVGEDWPDEHTQLLQSRKIDTTGLQIVEGEKTFFWSGKYLPNMNDRETLDVQLNVFGQFDPVLPNDYKACRYLFLANGSPTIQLKVLDQLPNARLAVADTMDLWINNEHDALMELLSRIDGLVLND